MAFIPPVSPFTYPSESDFIAYFGLDFPFGTQPNQIPQAQVTRALVESVMEFNPGLWSSQQEYTTAAMYLIAHQLCMNYKQSAQGIAGAGEWLRSAQNVGPTSVQFQIPQRVMENPQMAGYATTTYGMRYLKMCLPRLFVAFASMGGDTNP